MVLCALDLALQTQLQPSWEFGFPRTMPLTVCEDALGRSYLYVAAGNGGVSILSGVDRKPTELSWVNSLEGLNAMNLTQQGSLLYIALGDFFRVGGDGYGLAVVDISNPREPEARSLWKSGTRGKGASAVLAKGGTVYLACMNRGLMVFDASGTGTPKPIATFVPDRNFPKPNPSPVAEPNARGMALQGNTLFLANDSGGLHALDVSDPRKITTLGRYLNPGMKNRQQAFNNVVVDGNLAYIAEDYAGVEIVDISDPKHMKSVSWWNPWHAEKPSSLWLNSPGHVNQLALDKVRHELLVSAGDSELLVLDVHDPSNPVLSARYGKPKDGKGAWGVSLGRHTAYVCFIKALVPFQGTWSGIRAFPR